MRAPDVPTASTAPDIAPSPWICRFANLIEPGGSVLDLACGSGRHSKLMLERGHGVVALDIDPAKLGELAAHPGLEAVGADLEDGAPWPLGRRQFSAVIVTNYLYRPVMPAIVAAVKPEGLLLYETFAQGNEKYGRPANPDYLLRPGELLQLAANAGMRVLAYEDLEESTPRPGCRQRLAARKATSQKA